MMGVSLFLGYGWYELQDKYKALQVQVNKSPQNEAVLLTAVVDQGKKLTVIIKQGVLNNKDINNQDEFCVLSVVNKGKSTEKEFYLTGEQKNDKNENDCPDKSKATLKEDGTWKLEHKFDQEEDRIIRVIYKNKSTTNDIHFPDIELGSSILFSTNEAY